MRLEAGQVAVVTGAASGLGRGFAEAFAQRGLDVVLADVEAGPLGDAVEGLRGPGSAFGVTTDVSSWEQVEALAAATLDRFGRVDLICNNAGVTTLGPRIWEVEPRDWEWVLSVNLGGVINGIRAFVPHLVAQGSGHVVNTASMAGITVPPRHGPYLAAKHAVVGLSEALSLELDNAEAGVGVTVVCPGVVQTNIQHAERNRPDGATGDATLSLDADEMNEVRAWGATITGPPITAEAAASIVMDAIEADRLHVAPNGSLVAVQARIDRLLADLGADRPSQVRGRRRTGPGSPRRGPDRRQRQRQRDLSLTRIEASPPSVPAASGGGGSRHRGR